MQNHQYGISPEKCLENMDLCNFFKILTTSADSDNKVYVSTVQARNYPVTAFQWHLEKNAFKWGLSMIPHSEDAVQVTLIMLQISLSGRDTTRYTSLTATIIQVCQVYMPWISLAMLYMTTSLVMLIDMYRGVPQ